ncbi:MAG: T3SS (YopN, CesT) and YbjN peptide-binding chaperone 1 [Anaerolineae bacterium]
MFGSGQESQIEFKTKAHEEGYNKVKKHVQSVFGEMAKVVPNRPVFLLRAGSTLTHVAVTPWGDDDSVVLVRAYVVYGAELAPDLLKFLLQENHRMRFGAFGIDNDGDIFFEHSIVGSTCDKGELKASVLAVGQTADNYDERIRERWGGVREMDRIKEMMG